MRLSAPLEVEIMLTWKCQNDCIFCEPWLSGPHDHKRHELDTLGMLELLAEVISNKPLFVFLTGGEPFVRNDFPEITACLHKARVKWLVSSNGLFTKDSLRMAAEAGLQDLQISIQGTGQEHCKMVRSVFDDSFRRTLNGIRMAVESGINVSVAVIPTIFNYKNLPALVHEVGKAGARVFRILRFMPFRPYMLRWTVSPKKLSTYFPVVAEICRQYDMVLDISQTPTGEKQRPIDSMSHPYETTCPAGKTKLAILPDGCAVPCYSFHENEFRLGNVLEQGLLSVWNHPLLEELRAIDGEAFLGKCGTCTNRGICYSCRSIAYRFHGDLRESDSSCWASRSNWSTICDASKCASCSFNCDKDFRNEYVF